MHSTCRIESLNWREPSEFKDAHFYYEYSHNGLPSDPAELSHKAVAFSFSSPNPAERSSLGFLQPLRASGYSSHPPASTTSQDARTGFSYPWVGSGPLAVVGAHRGAHRAAHVGVQGENEFYCHHRGTLFLRTWTLEPEACVKNRKWTQQVRRAGR